MSSWIRINMFPLSFVKIISIRSRSLSPTHSHSPLKYLFHTLTVSNNHNNHNDNNNYNGKYNNDADELFNCH